MEPSAVRHLTKIGGRTCNRLIKCAYVSKILTSKVIAVPISNEEDRTINLLSIKHVGFISQSFE